MILTAAQLAAIAPHCDAEILAPALASAAAERQIDTSLRLAHWLAQLSVESQGLTVFVENLNYSAARLCQVWPGRFPNLVRAVPFAYNPEDLANNVYGGRLGNTEPGDGWKFRGRGLIMITGRENYQKFGEIVGIDLIAEPDKAGWPIISPRIAAAFWAMHNLNPLADNDDIEGITRAIQGGSGGLDARRAALVKAKHVLGVA